MQGLKDINLPVVVIVNLDISGIFQQQKNQLFYKTINNPFGGIK
tara:strand:- start:1353 stop:1484 length:132 start_codon:yes stop_codon:yes gene_type:complete